MRNQRYACPRCGGMMVETYSELLSPSDKGEDVLTWRCVNCGEYVDGLVLLNRWAQQGLRPISFHLKRLRSVPRPPSPLATRRRRAAA